MTSKSAAVLLLLISTAGLLFAQSVNTTIGRGSIDPTRTIFDEIADRNERTAFRELWTASDPAKKKELALRFADAYPRSVVLKEAYEFAARAFVATGDHAGGLYWAARSLRLLPENPFLLVLVADVAAKRSQDDLAETSARDALSYLLDADAPEPLASSDWPRARSRLQSTATLALAQVVAHRGDYTAAETLLTESLTLDPENLDAVYVFGVVKAAQHQDTAAAPALAHVIRGGGELADAAKRALLPIFRRLGSTNPSGFDDYVASLHWSGPAAPDSGALRTDSSGRDKPIKGQASYAGSAACRDCHPREYQSWQRTGMAKMVRPYRQVDAIGDFQSGQVVANDARPSIVDGRAVIDIRAEGETRWARYPVDYIIGSKWQQAYATRLADGRIAVFPIQYSRIHSKWLNYWEAVDSPGSARTDITRFGDVPDGVVYQSTCAACHTSQLKFADAAGGAQTAAFREGGINCEMCHGPSATHVTQMSEGGKSTRAARTPVDFRRLSPAESVAVCAQCHAQSAVHDRLPGGEANYVADANPFYRTYAKHLPSDFPRSAFYRDGRYRATTFIVESFTRSQCFRKGGATCASCHDPHPAQTRDNPASLKFASDSDEMCLQCHVKLRGRSEAHTRHAAGSEASRCVSCHMPRIQEALLFQARSHEIDDIPDEAMTARFGPVDSPNACLGCHSERTIAWLREAMSKRTPL